MIINPLPKPKHVVPVYRQGGGIISIAANILIKLCIFIFPVAITTLFISIYNEPNNEASYIAFADAIFTDKPFMDWYFLCHIFINKLYYLFYDMIPSVSWYRVFLFSYSLLGLLLCFLVVNKLVPGKLRLTIAWMLLFFSTLLTDFYIQSNVRSPVMICGGSLMLLLLSDQFKYRSLLYWGCILTFILGGLIRLEPAAVVLIIAYLFALFCYSGLKAILKLFFVPSIFILGMTIYIALDMQMSDSYYKKTEPDLYYQIVDKNNIIPLSQMETKVDTVRYKAALWWMVTEPDVMTVAFLKSLIVPDKIFSIKYLRQRHDKVKEILLPRVKKYISILLLNLFFISLAAYHFFQADLKRNFIRLVTFNLLAWGLVYLITFFIKMEDRLFISLFSLVVLFNFLYLFNNHFLEVLKQKRTPRFITAAVMLLITILSLFQVIAEKRKFDENIAINRSMITSLTDIAKGKNIVFSSTGLDIIEFRFFSEVKFPKTRLVMCYDIGSYSSVPRYKEFLDKTCNCNSSSMHEFFQYLLQNKDELIYVSQMERTGLIREYLEVIHGMKVDFNLIEAQYPAGQLVRFYKIRNRGS